jgi:hypothetical protein
MLQIVTLHLFCTKARHKVEAKTSFNLQEQMEKAARFKEWLRRERNSVLWPNALATKWRGEICGSQTAEREREEEMAEAQ